MPADRFRWPRLAVLAAVLAAVTVAAAFAGCAGRSPMPIEGRLAPCPSSPNCVSSQIDRADTVHHVDPLDLVGEPSTASQRLLIAVRGVRGAGEALLAGDAIRVVFHTPSHLFHDDVDLIVDRVGGVIHVRSASRIGYGDFGVNRARVEAIRAAWVAATADDRAPTVTGSLGAPD